MHRLIVSYYRQLDDGLIYLISETHEEASSSFLLNQPIRHIDRSFEVCCDLTKRSSADRAT